MDARGKAVSLGLFLLFILMEGLAFFAFAGRPQGRDHPLPVQVQEVATGRLGRRVIATGTLYPKSEVKLMSQAEGQVREVLVREGDNVKEGQVLVRLDDTVRRIELALAKAEMDAERARMAEAEANFKSRESLHRTGVISQQEWLKVTTELNRARAEVEKMRQRVELLRVQVEYYFEIRSPIAGVVTERRIEPGDLATPRAHLFTLAHVETLRVRAPVSELDLPRLREGQNTLVEVDAYPGRRLQGKLTHLFPQADPKTRQVVAEVELPNPERALRPGLHARLTFEPQLGREALILPAHAVEWSESGDQTSGFVYVLARRPPGPGGGDQGAEGGRQEGRGESRRGPEGSAEARQGGQGRGGGGPRFVAQKRKVHLGESLEGRVEILEGIKVGEKVIVSAIGQLRDGLPVRVVTE